MSKVNVGLVQMTCSGDKAANLAKAIDGVRKAAADGAQIVCLQELFTSLYFCDVEDYKNFELAEPIPGPTTDQLASLAKELKISENEILSAMNYLADGKVLPSELAIIDYDGFDEQDLEEIAEYINFKRAQKEKKKAM